MTVAPSSVAGVLARVPPNLPTADAGGGDDDDVGHGGALGGLSCAVIARSAVGPLASARRGVCFSPW